MQQIDTSRLQTHWDMRAAGNFICGGSGTGLVVASALWVLLPGGGVPRLALAAGMLCVMLGLSLVWLEIGKPWRAFNVFFHPRTSWMTREGILAAPLLASCAAAAWFDSRALVLLAAALAAGFVYCQARMLRASRAIPAWSHPRTVPLILATALAEGTGLFLVLGGAGSAAMVALALAAALAREAAREAYRRGLVHGHAPEGTLAWFARRETRVLHALRWLAVLLMLAALGGVAGAAGPLLAAFGGALAAATGWAMKTILVTRAAYTRGARIPQTPARGRGNASAVRAFPLPGQGRR